MQRSHPGARQGDPRRNKPLEPGGVRVDRNVPRLAAALDDPVALIDEDDTRQVSAGLLIAHLGVANENDNVARAHQMSGRPIDTDPTPAPLTGDHIGGQTVAISAITDIDALTGQKISSIKKVGVHRNGANVEPPGPAGVK